MNKIKPCPFCGTEVKLSKTPLWHGDCGYYNCFEFKIVCPKCGCSVTYNKNDTVYCTDEEAIHNVIETWNKRDESNSTATDKKDNTNKIIWITTYWKAGIEPVVSPFDNYEAAEICAGYYKKQGYEVCIDKCTVFHKCIDNFR